MAFASVVLRFHCPSYTSPRRLPSAAPQSRRPLFLHRNPTDRRSIVTPPSVAPSASSESEEARWLREEQRWLREEQRWLREESRWSAERESLLHEIASLREKLEAIERDVGRVASVEVLLRALKERAPPPPPPPVLVEEAGAKEMVLEVKEVVPEEAIEKGEEERRVLRKGVEGDDVRLMQEALERIGFYSTEEDMEFHMFSDGTERAVKAWQASLDVQEDGIMTSELLKKLYAQSGGGDCRLEAGLANDGKDESNGVPIASVHGITEIQQSIRKDNSNKEVERSNKVFLLGENRWEEPSRLVSKDKLISSRKDGSPVKCLSCRGEGRLLCTECDGTGEPNIEPQFLEWIDEATKCPYCEGSGYTICDVCEGKAD